MLLKGALGLQTEGWGSGTLPEQVAFLLWATLFGKCLEEAPPPTSEKPGIHHVVSLSDLKRVTAPLPASVSPCVMWSVGSAQ